MSSSKPWWYDLAIWPTPRRVEIARAIKNVAMDPVWDHASFRFYADGTESGSTAIAAQDTDPAQGDIANDTTFGWRVEINNSGSGNGSIAPAVQYLHVEGGNTWTNVGSSDGTGTPVISSASASLTDDEATTNRLTAGTGSFAGGRVDEADGQTTTSDTIQNGNHGEWLFSLEIDSTQVSNGDTIHLRAVEENSTPTLLANWTGSAAQLATITVSAATEHTATPSDTADFTDDLDVGVGTSVSDTVELGEDFDTVWTGVFDADGVDLSDTVGRDHAGSPSDTAEFGETLAAQTGYVGSVTDGLELTDTQTTLAAWGDSLTDGVELTDAATYPDSARSVDDGVELTDSLSVGVGDALADGVELTDSTNAGVGDSVDDGVELTDALAVGVGDALTDGVELTDAATHPDSARSVTDGVELGEDFTTSWTQTFDAEGVQLTDSAVGDMSARSVSDGVDLGDDTDVDVATSLTDGLELTDSADYDSVDRTATDGLELTDALAVGVGDSLTDGVELTDSQSYSTAHTGTLTDGLEFGEDFTTTVGAVGTPTGIELTDSLSVGVSDSLTDGVELTDSVVGVTPSFTGQVTDGVELTDATGVGVGDAVSDGVELTDSLSVVVALSEALTDGVELTDLATRSESASLIDGVELTDAAVAESQLLSVRGKIVLGEGPRKWEDSYDTLDTGSLFSFAGQVRIGQSWQSSADPYTIYRIGVWMMVRGSPTDPGDIVMNIKAHSGVYGTSSVPTGAALATSSTYAIEDIPPTPTTANAQLMWFEFPAGFTPAASTNYTFEVVIDNTGAGLNYVALAGDSSAPTHGGNVFQYISSYSVVAGSDLNFIVESQRADVVGVAASTSDGIDFSDLVVYDGMPSGASYVSNRSRAFTMRRGP